MATGLAHHQEVEFSDRFRARRQGLGLTQEQLADRLGIRQGQVSAYERGKQTPRGERLLEIAEIMGVSSRWLMTGDSEASPDEKPLAHWKEFLTKYEHLSELSEEDISAMKTFAGRTHRIRGWYDWAQLAEWIRNRRPSATFEAVVAADKDQNKPR